MAHSLLKFSVVIAFCSLAGCLSGGVTVESGANTEVESNTAISANEGDAHADSSVHPALPAPSATPQEVVHAFLDASRGGREELATELLSSKAREATSSQGLALDPPGSSSMVYRLGDVEFPTEDKQAAYVISVWQEEGEAGAAERFEVTWILRRQQEGWRIAGMASRAEQEAEPVLINFEDVADLHKIKPAVGGEPVVE